MGLPKPGPAARALAGRPGGLSVLSGSRCCLSLQIRLSAPILWVISLGLLGIRAKEPLD